MLAVSLILLGTVLLAVPSGAVAQEPGVTVDPNSPAGKEYAIPFDQARAKASGKQGAGSHASSSRFGEGIDSGSGKSGADSGGSGGRRKSGKSKDKKHHDENLSLATPTGGSGGGGSGGGDGGGTNSAALLTGGIALAVLLIGGALALMTRRTATDDV